jgi:ABC-type lipoprotein export system ATPase subunit/ribosomal protein S18 acetylase RimI-like enzyme
MTIIKLESKIERSPRVVQLEGMFDLPIEKISSTEIPLNIPDLKEKDWNVGLIVGPSGSGKSTIAKTLFNQELTKSENFQWSKNKAVIDDFPKSMTIKEITELLSSVGFSSPPAWLRPYEMLSNGEQFRVSMARVMAETSQQDIAVIDEFTSVVDRTVAKIGSVAIGKTIRRRNQKFVAVGCHYDIKEWLQPDWIYEPATGNFRWEYLHQRPDIELTIFRAKYEAWRAFSRHHYLTKDLNKAAQVYVGCVNNQPAVLMAVLTLPHPKLKNARRISRIVVLPDFQGVGIANKFMDAVSGALKQQGYSVYITTSHPGLIRSLNNSSSWSMSRKPSRVRIPTLKGIKRLSESSSRMTTGFVYAGIARPDILPILAPKPDKATKTP